MKYIAHKSSSTLLLAVHFFNKPFPPFLRYPGLGRGPIATQRTPRRPSSSPLLRLTLPPSEHIHRRRNPAGPVRHPREMQPHLHPRQRPHQHQVVEVAEMPDPEH